MTVFSAFIFRQFPSIFLIIYSSVALLGIVASVLDRKLLQTTKANYDKNISVFQRSTSNYMLIGTLFIIINNILELDSQIEKINGGINEIF